MEKERLKVSLDVQGLGQWKEYYESFSEGKNADDEDYGMVAWSTSSDTCGEDIKEMAGISPEKRGRWEWDAAFPNLEHYGMCWKDFI